MQEIIRLESYPGYFCVKFGGSSPRNGKYKFTDIPSFFSKTGVVKNTEYDYDYSESVWFDVEGNDSEQDRDGVLSFTATTEENEAYNGTFTVSCAWTITQKAAQAPPSEPCTFEFYINGDSYIENRSAKNIVLHDNGYHDSFTATATTGEGDYLNAGFEANVSPQQQQSLVTILPGATPFIVSFDSTDLEKKLEMAYNFQGEKDYDQFVSVEVSLKNLATSETSKVTLDDGALSKYFDLEPWFREGQTVAVRLSFNFLAL